MTDNELRDTHNTHISTEIEELKKCLFNSGIKSFYKTAAIGDFKGQIYPEYLITVFGETETDEAICFFKEWNIKNNKNYSRKRLLLNLTVSFLYIRIKIKNSAN